jgi:hypothetical protein
MKIIVSLVRVKILKQLHGKPSRLDALAAREYNFTLTKENFTCITREPIYWRLRGPNVCQLLISNYLRPPQFTVDVFQLVRTADPLNFIISNLEFESRNMSVRE